MATAPAIDMGPIERSINRLSSAMSSSITGMTKSVASIKEGYAKTAAATRTSFAKSLRESAKSSLGGQRGIAEAVRTMRADLIATGMSQQEAQSQALASINANIASQVESMKSSPVAIAKAMGTVSMDGMKFLAGKISGFFGKDKEEQNQEERRQGRMMTLFKKMDAGIGAMGKSLAQKGKAVAGSLFGMLKKGALMLAVPALIAFMKSPMFDKLKVWVVDTLVPNLKKMVDIIVDIATTLTNWVSVTVDWIVLAFTDPKAALDALWSGIKSLGKWLYDNTILKAWNWIKGIFGFGPKEETLAEGDMDATEKKGLWAWIKGIPSAIWTWIKGLFGFSGTEEADPKIETGETKGFFSKVMRAIIPAGIWTFLEDPILWFWINVLGITTGVDGKKPSAAEAAEQIKSGEADGIFAKVMGAFLPQGMIEFILDPIDWIFVNVLKLGGEGEKKKSTLQKAGYILGTAVELFKKVLKAILPDGLVDFITAPIDWFFESVLNIKTGEVLDSVSEAHGVEKGDANGIWQSMLDAILPPGLAKFLGDPIGYIFTDILNLGGEGEKKKSALEQSKVVAGVAVGLFKSVLEAILPDGLVAFMFKPLDWLFGKMGISVGESMKSAEEAAGVTAGDAKGLWSSILGAILPAGLVDFITNPLKWLLAKAGIVKNKETGELTDATGKVLTKEEAAKQATGIFSKVLKAILPDGLVDFIMGPVNWVLSKLGLTGEKKKPDDGTGGWKFPGMPTIADIKAFLPEWLTDPIGWVKGFFGGGDDEPDPAVVAAQNQALEKAQSSTGKEFKSAQQENTQSGNQARAGMSDKERADAVAAMGAFERDMGDDTFDQDRISELVVGGMITKEDLQAMLRDTSDVDISKQDRTYLNSMLDHIKRREKKETETGKAQMDMAEAATTKGSIFTHDIELANILRRGFDEQIKAGGDFAMNAAKLAAISQPPAGAGGGGSSTVMITNAPSTSNVANTKVETAAGVSDPHTQLAGVY